MVSIPPIISVDDHVVEPPDLWQRWLPAQWREKGPRVVRAPYEIGRSGAQYFRMASDGPETDFWVFEDQSAGIETGLAAAGQPTVVVDPIKYEDMRPGCYDVPARLADMDVNHVERSMCFPTFPRFCGQTFLEAKDKALGSACVRAYNDWMVEEWSAGSGGRLIPLCLVPLWDPTLAAAEVRRNAARGVHAVAFSEVPQHLGLPSLYSSDRHWDPFLAACDETGTVVCVHVGSGSRLFESAPDAPGAATVTLMAINSQMCLTDWLLSGVMARFGDLKLALSEGQVGWIPYHLQRIDDVWRMHGSNPVAGIPAEITELPSSYVRGRLFGCVVHDDFGIEVLGGLGIDQLTFESDYPHMDSTWPHTREYAEHALAGLREEDVYKVVRGNAINLFTLPEALPTATVTTSSV
jgi:predicted TIM-barrel fold metal-dependent hydrolase